jgi:hypothetical protein
MTAQTKICTRCNFDRPLTDFSSTLARGKVRLRSECKHCESAAKKAHYKPTARRTTTKTKSPRSRNAPETAVEADTKIQMRILDGLPRQVKEVVWSAPVPLDLRQVGQLHARYGLKCIERLVGAIFADYPDWVPG